MRFPPSTKMAKLLGRLKEGRPMNAKDVGSSSTRKSLPEI